MKYLDVVMNITTATNAQECEANANTVLNYIVNKLTSFKNIDLLETTHDVNYKYAYFSIHGQSNVKLVLRVYNNPSASYQNRFSLSLKGDIVTLTSMALNECKPTIITNSDGSRYDSFNFHLPYIADSDNNLKVICYYTDYASNNRCIFMDSDDNNIYVGIVNMDNLECYECNSNKQIYKGNPSTFCAYNITIANTEICVTRDIVMALDSNVYLLPTIKSIQTNDNETTCDCMINGVQTTKIGCFTVL